MTKPSISIALMHTLSPFFELNWSNHWIRWIFQEGIDLKLENFQAMTTETVQLPQSILTDQVLTGMRNIYRQAQN